jgi:hypothetical protein
MRAWPGVAVHGAGPGRGSEGVDAEGAEVEAHAGHLRFHLRLELLGARIPAIDVLCSAPLNAAQNVPTVLVLVLVLA